MAGVKVKLELDADVNKLRESVQRTFSAPAGNFNANIAARQKEQDEILRQLLGGAPIKPAQMLNPRLASERFLEQGATKALMMGELLPYGGPVPPKLPGPGGGAGGRFAGMLAGALGGPEGVLLTAGIMAAVVALKALQTTIKGTVESFEQARKIYAHSMLSGLGIGFSVSRQNLADVLGVSEKDVYQFGAAIAELSPKLKFADQNIARLAPNLTAVAYEFEILKKDTEVFFMTLANDLAPEIKGVIQLMDSFVRSLANFADGLKKHISQILELIVGTLTGSETAKAIVKALVGSMESNFVGAPKVPAMNKQLPASALERMGLVIGGFGASTSDYARRTAAATERTNKILERIAGGNASGGTPFFDPLVSNP